MKKKKHSLFALLDYPANMFPDISEINIVSRSEVTVDKCKKILLYEDYEIKLQLKDFIVRICGNGLNLKNYFAHSICIRGEIDALFLEGAGEE